MTLATTAAPRLPKLPLRATIRLAYATFFDGFRDVLRISSAWLVACALLGAMSNWLKLNQTVDTLRYQMVPRTPITSWLVDGAFFIAFLLAGVSIAVAWHRLLILHEAPPPSGSNITTGRVWRYLGTALLITLVILVPTLVAIAPVFLLFWGWLAIVVIGVYIAALLVGGRLSIMLPAQAVDDRTMTLSAAWDITRGNSWRLFWGYIACTIPTAVLAQLAVMLLVGVPDQQSLLDGSFAIKATVLSVVFTAYYLLTLPIAIGFLSHAYRHFTGRA
ncbi:hypothetical protein JQ557_14430 [Bradyrhizobium sp. U87765 SZCCT0131]|uniref:hypothetical protein n=1 Tax=unclassified Bradyrhizobium TaxID=2631580 RepID=UPI001BA537FE|nr:MULTISPECIES: hypothetical protein [unclassified Bradyrhizobium]MBR1219197.1 hypothetical protein [Bradyrhizobium sp. U87765 SZCCT0131]MBR1261848.1 hypothetical protein [Bradyrhizobium sp. U87765 SZCCT0134]MBR1306299.1 hypothetical protein [Bradyrhizobium sp. U87765 SZCCT0110]MBR1317630.1 hypothetical protein [Bradyrhizobium sp. U87765 SZCCT0109]MBR1351332.1 hypothetical protein [Bradyrhizobium sp. U87765 SZCCT0048]